MELIIQAHEKELIKTILANSDSILSFIKERNMSTLQTALVLTEIIEMNKRALGEALSIRVNTLLLEKELEAIEAQNRLLRFEIEQLKKAVDEE